MSVNYASGLSPYDFKGKCGMPETFEAIESINSKIDQLASFIHGSSHTVVHTGAGISTSIGIPDFRGPRGVWTLEEKGEIPQVNVTFDDAVPSFTHMALRTLEIHGYLQFVVTQNIDGLNMRSGFPRDRLSELHGNMFIIECENCRRRVVLSRSVSTVGRKSTGRNCGASKSGGRTCRGKMRDVILDWEDNLPDDHLNNAYDNCKIADLSICLGTSLQIKPAGDLPILVKKKEEKGKLVIVNLQKTKHDSKADLIIHQRVDLVMEGVLKRLGLECMQYNGPEIIDFSRHCSDKDINKV